MEKFFNQTTVEKSFTKIRVVILLLLLSHLFDGFYHFSTPSTSDVIMNMRFAQCGITSNVNTSVLRATAVHQFKHLYFRTIMPRYVVVYQ